MSKVPVPEDSDKPGGEFLASLEVEGNIADELLLMARNILSEFKISWPGQADLYYHFTPESGSTTVVFMGEFWLYPMGGFLKLLRAKGIAVKGWSNWPCPAIKDLHGVVPPFQESLDSPLVGINPEAKVPMRGYFTSHLRAYVKAMEEVDTDSIAPMKDAVAAKEAVSDREAAEDGKRLDALAQMIAGANGGS